MGRYYWGDIEGKFWFGVQSSDDISNLVSCNYKELCYWNGCNCALEDKDDLGKWCEDNCKQDCEHKYCYECFENKKEHIKSLEEEEEYEEGERLYREGGEILYTIDKAYLDELRENMKKIEGQIDKKVVEAYEKVENNERILNLFSGIYDEVEKVMNTWENNEVKKEQYKLIARYGLGLQIKYFLEQEENTQCVVYCEI